MYNNIMKNHMLKRDVTVEECDWLFRNFKKGEMVQEFYGTTYGCVSNEGVACCHDSNGPFFELPYDALEIPQKELFTV